MPQKRLNRPTMGVPEAGAKYFGLARNASYAAAKRGEIPTVKIGGRIFAVVSAIERQLEAAGSDFDQHLRRTSSNR